MEAQARTVGRGLDVLTAKRQSNSPAQWAEEHISQVLGDEDSTAPASGSGDPHVSTITWTTDTTPPETNETEVKTWGTQAEHDQMVQAMKDAIEDAGGTIVSVT